MVAQDPALPNMRMNSKEVTVETCREMSGMLIHLHLRLVAASGAKFAVKNPPLPLSCLTSCTAKNVTHATRTLTLDGALVLCASSLAI